MINSESLSALTAHQEDKGHHCHAEGDDGATGRRFRSARVRQLLTCVPHPPAPLLLQLRSPFAPQHRPYRSRADVTKPVESLLVVQKHIPRVGMPPDVAHFANQCAAQTLSGEISEDGTSVPTTRVPLLMRTDQNRTAHPLQHPLHAPRPHRLGHCPRLRGGDPATDKKRMGGEEDEYVSCTDLFVGVESGHGDLYVVMLSGDRKRVHQLFFGGVAFELGCPFGRGSVGDHDEMGIELLEVVRALLRPAQVTAEAAVGAFQPLDVLESVRTETPLIFPPLTLQLLRHITPSHLNFARYCQ
eukprot:Hpha_TRINITY_DN8323_c0_g2::TRINITY_DN8323_c0_g2_i1::g.154337::m.154337